MGISVSNRGQHAQTNFVCTRSKAAKTNALTQSFLGFLDNALSKAGMRVCAIANENTNFGPVVNNFGVNPLKNDVIPSFLNISLTIVTPVSLESKFLFWIRVLITSNGAEMTNEAQAPQIEAPKF